MAFRNRWGSIEEQFSTPYKQLLLIGGIVFVLGAGLALAFGTTDSESAASTGFPAPGVQSAAAPSPVFVSSGEIFSPLAGYEYGEAPASLVTETKSRLTELLPTGSVEAIEVRTVERHAVDAATVIVLVVDASVVTPSFAADVGRGIANRLGSPPQQVSVAGHDGYIMLFTGGAAYVLVEGNAVIEVAGSRGTDSLRVTRLLLEAL